MGKVRYKEPSPHFAQSTSNKSTSTLRSSIGQEGYVGEYYNLSVDLLIPYAKQARKIFDENQILELASTIKEHGIQNPLLVVASKEYTDKFEVVSGERRLRAAKLLGLQKVPCLIISPETAEEIALIENIQRADLHPIEIADAIYSIINQSQWGEVSKLADKIGKDQSTISHYLSYAQLPDVVKKKLIDSNIRARDVLRKVLKEKSVEGMLSLLEKSKHSHSSLSVLRISLADGEFKIQDRSLSKLNHDQLVSLKKEIKNLSDKIDDLVR